MFLKQVDSRHLVEVLDIAELTDPYKPSIRGRLNVGEDMPEPEEFAKETLRFPSGEKLPACWIDSHYRDDEIRH